MKINKIEIDNFKCFTHVEVDTNSAFVVIYNLNEKKRDSFMSALQWSMENEWLMKRYSVCSEDMKKRVWNGEEILTMVKVYFEVESVQFKTYQSMIHKLMYNKLNSSKYIGAGNIEKKCVNISVDKYKKKYRAAIWRKGFLEFMFCDTSQLLLQNIDAIMRKAGDGYAETLKETLSDLMGVKNKFEKMCSTLILEGERLEKWQDMLIKKDEGDGLKEQIKLICEELNRISEKSEKVKRALHKAEDLHAEFSEKYYEKRESFDADLCKEWGRVLELFEVNYTLLNHNLWREISDIEDADNPDKIIYGLAYFIACRNLFYEDYWEYEKEYPPLILNMEFQNMDTRVVKKLFHCLKLVAEQQQVIMLVDYLEPAFAEEVEVREF